MGAAQPPERASSMIGPDRLAPVSVARSRMIRPEFGVRLVNDRGHSSGRVVQRTAVDMARTCRL
jgi:hypothetical protein